MGDHHIPLITSLLSFTPQLQSLSLANNYFTDDGITQFSSSLFACPLLIVLDLSNNFFGDKGMLALEPSLRALKSLGHLDLSRNRLTKESAKSLAFAIARYGSLLTSINLSYNVMGDDVAALSVLLLTTEATAIENINLSFCGISSLGLTKLAHALVGCESLHNLSLQGNFGDEKSSILLLDAMTAHQRKFGVSPPLSELTDDSGFQSRNFRKKSALCIHLGGLVIEDQPLSIEHKTMRMAIAYGSQYSTLTRTVLSRRVAKHPPKPSKDPKVQHHYLPNESMVCLRVQLLHWMESISDLIEELARSLGADTRQLQLLSASEMDETDSCFVIFVPLEASALAQEAFQRQATSGSATIPGSPGSPRRPIERLSSKIEITSTSLPSVDDILQALVDFSRISSPILRKIGIRTVYIRRRSPNGELCAPFHCHIRGSGYGGQGVLAEFIPPLFPMASVMESVATTSNKQSYDEDEETDEAQSRDRTEFAVTGPEVSERDRVESTVWYDEDDEGDGNEWKENESEGKTDQSEVIENFDLLPSTVLEEVGGNIDQKLTQAIRTLQKEGRIPMDAGVFWHQAFSSEQDGEKVVEILDDALDEDGLFHFVSIRKQLCDAMLRRDVGAMESYLEHMKSHGIPGGAAQALGEQLLSEVLGLMRDGDNLDSLAEGPDDIGIVENFLMACGRIGYSGKETLVAIELREYLVRWALQDNPDYSTELPGLFDLLSSSVDSLIL
jgi:Ran GTPase-activating protein (RanGAP) involved in mRNA processing and transport